MRWNQGREVIDRMLADSELQHVPASREHADRLVLQARVHLVSANEISEGDPAGGYTLVYDAARKVLPPSLFEHPAAELSVDDSAQLGEDRRQPGHIA